MAVTKCTTWSAVKPANPAEHDFCANCGHMYSEHQELRNFERMLPGQIADGIARDIEHGEEIHSLVRERSTIHAPDYERIKLVEVSLKRFVDAMKYKLLKNAHKGKWEYPLESAIAKLKAEVAELEAAIKTGNTTEILLEAADVGNFAMIAASIAIERGVDEKT